MKQQADNQDIYIDKYYTSRKVREVSSYLINK